jgi:hypothetical protein
MNSTAFWVVALLWCVLWTVAGGKIGDSKGRALEGILLGFLLSFVGVIIVVALPPTKEKQQERDNALAEVIRNQMQATLGAATAGEASSRGTDIHRLALAEAVRRDPTLRDSGDPETRIRLAASVAAIEEELRIVAELEALQADEAAQSEQELAKERDRLTQLAEEEAARERARVRALQDEERRRAIEAMPPVKRWLTIHKTLVGVVVTSVAAAALILAVILAPSVISTIQRASAQSAAQAEAAKSAQDIAERKAAEEQKLQPLKDSCNELLVDKDSTPPEVRIAWANCPAQSMRLALVASFRTPAEALLSLATSADPVVKMALADRKGKSDEVYAALAEDQDAQVRSHLASNPDIPHPILLKLMTDSEQAVKFAAVGNPSATAEDLDVAAQDLDPKVREVVAGNPSLSPATKGRLARDPESSVRMAVAKQLERTNLEELFLLANDKSPEVAAAALTRMASYFSSDGLDDAHKAQFNAAARRFCGNPEVRKNSDLAILCANGPLHM